MKWQCCNQSSCRHSEEAVPTVSANLSRIALQYFDAIRHCDVRCLKSDNNYNRHALLQVGAGRSVQRCMKLNTSNKSMREWRVGGGWVKPDVESEASQDKAPGQS